MDSSSSANLNKAKLFQNRVASISDQDDLLNFCRQSLLHGTPAVFEGRSDKYYAFRTRIANHFQIHFSEVFIVGSAMLGFSPHKGTEFSLESDIDVAITSPILYEAIMEDIRVFQEQIRRQQIAASAVDMNKYHRFLEYAAIGWMRPDLLPVSLQTKGTKRKWFEFFRSISFDKSEVGNYKVAGACYKSIRHLEYYSLWSLENIRNNIKVGAGI